MQFKIIRAEKPTFEIVEVREPLYKDISRAIQTAGLKMGELSLASLPKLLAHLIHECATFDGKRLRPEEIEEMPIGFFTGFLDLFKQSESVLEAVKASLNSTPLE